MSETLGRFLRVYFTIYLACRDQFSAEAGESDPHSPRIMAALAAGTFLSRHDFNEVTLIRASLLTVMGAFCGGFNPVVDRTVAARRVLSVPRANVCSLWLES